MIGLLVVLVVVGVILYIFNALVPMDGRIKTVINALVALFVFLYVLQVFGLWHGMPSIK
jgi:hypothetical protein